MIKNYIEIPYAWAPPPGFEIHGERVGDKTVFWLVRLCPRRKLRAKINRHMDPPADFRSYFRDCAGENN